MKHIKLTLILLAIFLLLTGCSSPAAAAPEEPTTPREPTEPPVTVYPLPDVTMDNLEDAILAVSLEEGKAYVDDTGKMQMDVTIYSYDQYDLVDISLLKSGDILVTHAGELEVFSVEQDDYGMVHVNGGLDNNGVDLISEDNGIFYSVGYNDHKNWHKVGDATIRVSVDFVFTDSADLEQGDVLYYPGSFLVGEVTNYDFTPYNTTIRVEAGQIVEMNRRFIP